MAQYFGKMIMEDQLEKTMHQVRRINNELALPHLKDVTRMNLENRKRKLLREVSRLACMLGKNINSLF